MSLSVTPNPCHQSQQGPLLLGALWSGEGGRTAKHPYVV